MAVDEATKLRRKIVSRVAKLAEALDAGEKKIAEAERAATEQRRQTACDARDLAVLVCGRDVRKALEYDQRATRLDPEDAETWDASAAG